MLKQVILQADVPRTLNIDQVSPDEEVIVKSISGLDPADVNLFRGEFAQAGGYYQGRRVGERNVVFNLKLNPDYAADREVSDIREDLYSTFYDPSATSDGVTMVFKDDRKPDRMLIGYTEKAPADLFSRETSMAPSLICVDPFFRSVNPVSFVDAVGLTTAPIDYAGSVQTGFQMQIKVKQAGVTQVVIEMNGKTMTLIKNFALNDIIDINTKMNSRWIRQNGTDVMATLTPTSTWLRLRRGLNTVKVYGNAVNDGKAAMMNYSYYDAWWGI